MSFSKDRGRRLILVTDNPLKRANLLQQLSVAIQRLNAMCSHSCIRKSDILYIMTRIMLISPFFILHIYSSVSLSVLFVPATFTSLPRIYLKIVIHLLKQFDINKHKSDWKFFFVTIQR